MIHNPEIDLAFDFVQNTNRNIFLTGKAGTGKTTFLHKLKDILPKRMVVVAPTGVAAINAGGVTIHSFFQMPFGPIIPGNNQGQGDNTFARKFNKRKINLIKTLDLLVIDEVSMVRSDLLDGIDQVLRRYKNPRLPFGGAQVLMIGDLQQLAPVCKDNEWNLLRDHYDTIYFFSSRVFQQANVLGIELKHIYRQQDNEFIQVLNEIRDNRLTEKSLTLLNARYKPGFRPKENEGYITLTTHNAIANRINQEQLEMVKTPVKTFEAKVSDNFPEYSFPTDQLLKLKTGAQVMFVKNDSSPEKRYFNGKIGKIIRFDNDYIYVQCPEESEPIEVSHEIWENIRYSINQKTKAIEEETTGSFTQYPLRLAWAITIHKSQGLTFEKAVIDAQAAFAHGQTYVALSRCKTLEGLVLGTRLSNQAIITDKTVGDFNQQVYDNPPDKKMLTQSKQDYVLSLLEELFSYRQIGYYLNKALQQIGSNLSIIHGDIQTPLKKMHEEGSKTLDSVAQKFNTQLKQITQTNDNELIQDRIKKASVYFLEQTNLLLQKPLSGLSFETDNRLVKKDLKETLAKITELLNVKQACFKSNLDGFDIKKHLEVRAFAALEKADKIYAETKTQEVEISNNPKLYNSLRTWRNTLADENDVPAYYIFTQKAIIGISNELPVTPEQFQSVKGVGPKKVTEYGEVVLEIVKTFCLENKIEFRTDTPEIAKRKKKVEKTPTKDISKSMWDNGKNIKEIAAERSFTEGTIEGHLAFFVITGEIDVEKLIDKKKLKTIVEFFEKQPEALIGEARASLGDSFSWTELRLGANHMEFVRNKKANN